MLRQGLMRDPIMIYFMNGGMNEGSNNAILTKEEIQSKMRKSQKMNLQNLINDLRGGEFEK